MKLEFLRQSIAQNKRFTEFKKFSSKILMANPAYVWEGATTEQLKEIATVRKCGRFPSVTYIHHTGVNLKKVKGMGCAIWRGAEPHFKLLQSRCKEDEDMVKEMTKVYLPLYEMEDNPQLYVFTGRGPDAAN